MVTKAEEQRSKNTSEGMPALRRELEEEQCKLLKQHEVSQGNE